ncbi:hypothetical protein Theco_0908 [Thermobacillus composti KWC4]|uniref:Uncharacterized protein n=1 Tax=Thermobacillus composti (strain DSM 18247 / JCM 13945 / KWC4) TaxID=717605 RepID=L0EBP3_THECK|nr:hypothetical protein [Thermobacillus composti]AGA57101.1 hypothetical protein Theco_0908 [Thermobacillus composti KWC4]
MKFGCGCFLFLSGLVGVFASFLGLIYSPEDRSGNLYNFVVTGSSLLLGFLLLRSFMREPTQSDPSQHQQTITTMQQTIHHSSGGSGQAADPDEPVTVECPGCGAPVTVSPFKAR